MSNSGPSILQYLLYPLTLAVAGYIFNSHLDDTKKTEVMEKFVPTLAGDSPAHSLLADRLIDKILDKSTAQDIHRITRETWRNRLHRAVVDGKTEEAKKIADAANIYGGDLGKGILADVEASTLAVLTGPQQGAQSGSSGASGKLDPSKGLEPSQASKQVLAAAAIAPQIQEAKSQSNVAQVSQTQQYSWIYLGPTTGGRNWGRVNFVEKNLPPQEIKNRTITASTDVFRRSELPKVENGEWKLGSITGVLPEGQRVLVKDIQSVPGVNNTELWWAWVVPQ
jgi:hypothetical protein